MTFEDMFLFLNAEFEFQCRHDWPADLCFFFTNVKAFLQVLTPLIRIVGNLACDDDCRQAMTKVDGLQQALKILLDAGYFHLRKETLWTLSNLTGTSVTNLPRHQLDEANGRTKEYCWLLQWRSALWNPWQKVAWRLLCSHTCSVLRACWKRYATKMCLFPAEPILASTVNQKVATLSQYNLSLHKVHKTFELCSCSTASATWLLTTSPRANRGWLNKTWCLSCFHICEISTKNVWNWVFIWFQFFFMTQSPNVWDISLVFFPGDPWLEYSLSVLSIVQITDSLFRFVFLVEMKPHWETCDSIPMLKYKASRARCCLTPHR